MTDARRTTNSKASRIAAIDIGSDTVHLLVAEVRPSTDGSHDGPMVRRIEEHGDLLEIGRRVATTGRVGKRVSTELEAVLHSYVKIARRRSDVIVISATEAMRRASDGPALVDSLSKELGMPVRVLSGTREAALGLAGALPRLAPSGPQLLIDSGGASTELTLTDGRRALASASLPIGAASLGAQLRGDPPQALDWALLGTRIGALLVTAPAPAPGANPDRAWATGGSAHNLAGLERTKGRSGDQRLTMPELEGLAGRLLAEPARKLARRSGEDPRRVAILPPGLLIVASVLAHYGLSEVTVVPEGLREGMAAAAFQSPDDWWQDRPASQ